MRCHTFAVRYSGQSPVRENNDYWHFCFRKDDKFNEVLVFAAHAVIADYDGNFVFGQNHPALGHSGRKHGGERALPKDLAELSTILII
jgi:hypothetical protein